MASELSRRSMLLGTSALVATATLWPARPRAAVDMDTIRAVLDWHGRMEPEDGYYTCYIPQSLAEELLRPPSPREQWRADYRAQRMAAKGLSDPPIDGAVYKFSGFVLTA